VGGLAGWSGFVFGVCSEAGCAFLVVVVETSPVGGAWSLPEAAPLGGSVAAFGFGEVVAPVAAVLNDFAPAAVAGFDVPLPPAVAVPGALRGDVAALAGFAPGVVVAPAGGLLAEALPVAGG